MIRHQQISKYGHIYSLTIDLVGNVNNETLVINSEAVLQIMEDADFYITHLVGSVSDSDGVGSPINDLLDPLADYNYGYAFAYPMAGAGQRSDRGIWFKFIDTKINRHLQSGIPLANAVTTAAQYLLPYDHTMIEFGSVFTPGYGAGWGKPIKFDYLLNRGERLKILFQNRQKMPGEIGAANQYVSIGFIGNRYEK